METLVLTIHILIAVALVVVVLLQRSEGGGLGIGGGGWRRFHDSTRHGKFDDAYNHHIGDWFFHHHDYLGDNGWLYYRANINCG